MAKRTPTQKELNTLLPALSVDLTNIVHEYIGNPMIIVLNVTDKRYIYMPIKYTSGLIDWGDGSFMELKQNGHIDLHSYKYPGKYIVHIMGDITGVSFEHFDELIELSQWGDFKLSNYKSMFTDCINLTSINTYDSPNLQFTTDLSNMFSGCRLLQCDISEWNTINITNMSNMFSNCIHFNSDISKWDTHNVTNMNGMFNRCSSFNADISKWDTNNVTNMNGMFYECSSFNADISKWRTNNVTNMNFMFYGCSSFNADISKWNTNNVTKMQFIFAGCSSFNADISKWNNVTDMNSMF